MIFISPVIDNILAALSICAVIGTALYFAIKYSDSRDKIAVLQSRIGAMMDEALPMQQRIDDLLDRYEALLAEADSTAEALKIQSQRVAALEKYSAHGKELLRYAAKQLGTDVASLAAQYDSANRKFEVFHLDADGFEV